MCLFLTANMAAVTSRSAGDDASFSSLELSYSRSPFDSEQKNELKMFFPLRDKKCSDGIISY